MHAVSDIIGELFIEEQLGSKIVPNNAMGQWPVFKGLTNDKPDNVITIADVDSITSGRIHRTGESLGPWGFQIRVRAKNYNSSQQKAAEISTFLDTVVRREFTVDDAVYLIQGIHQTNRASYMGADVNNRPGFVINGIMTFSQINQET